MPKWVPGIGPKTAAKIIGMYGERYLAEILENNIQAFSNLMDENGEFLFDDRQREYLGIGKHGVYA